MIMSASNLWQDTSITSQLEDEFRQNEYTLDIFERITDISYEHNLLPFMFPYSEMVTKTMIGSDMPIDFWETYCLIILQGI